MPKDFKGAIKKTNANNCVHKIKPKFNVKIIKKLTIKSIKIIELGG